MAKIVAITGCPTGVAHTLMAAAALKKTAAVMGHDIKVETQGAEGVKDPLSPRDVAEADLVIVASDIHVDMARFSGKPMVAVPVSDAIRKTRVVIENALADLRETPAAAVAEPLVPLPETPPVPAASRFLVGVTACPTGIAHTFMAAEALKKSAVALGHEIRVETQGSVGAKNRLTDEEIDRADAVVIAADAYVDTARFAGKRLYQTTTKAALHGGQKIIQEALALPEPAKTGLAGAMEEPRTARSSNLEGLKPVLILPLLSTLIVGLIMIFVIGPPVTAALNVLTAWLNGMQQSSAVILGILLGMMMAFDMGGPLNKAAYAFAVGLLASSVYGPMAAVMAAGMTPPLGLALAATLFKNRFTQEERDAGKAAACWASRSSPKARSPSPPGIRCASSPVSWPARRWRERSPWRPACG